MTSIDHVFSALSDPTRRHLLVELAGHGPATATALASNLAISRQAVAKHLNVLADAGMAASNRVGRETRYEAVVAPLSDVEAWIASLESQWHDRLGRLADSLGAGSPSAGSLGAGSLGAGAGESEDRLGGASPGEHRTL